MTEAEKILLLLQSSDEKNRLLGFQLMESQHMKKEVANLVNQSKLFNFLTIPLEKRVSPLFFFYKGETLHDNRLEVLRKIQGVDLEKYISSEHIRHLYNLMAEFTQRVLVKPFEEIHNIIVFEQKVAIHLELGMAWRVDHQIYQRLQGHLKTVQKLTRMTEAQLKEFYKQAILDRQAGKVKKDHLDWINMSRKLQGLEFLYDFDQITPDTVQFSVLIRFPLSPND